MRPLSGAHSVSNKGPGQGPGSQGELGFPTSGCPRDAGWGQPPGALNISAAGKFLPWRLLSALWSPQGESLHLAHSVFNSVLPLVCGFPLQTEEAPDFFQEVRAPSQSEIMLFSSLSCLIFLASRKLYDFAYFKGNF